MLSLEFQQFAQNLKDSPCDNPKRIGYANLRKIQEERIQTESAGCPGVAQQMAKIGGIQGEWLLPEKAGKGKMVLYIHGGGWSLGSIRQTRLFLAPMAACFQVPTLHFDYRLMPEHPYPAGLDDCFRIYTGLLEEGYRGENILLAGESAGANLALALLLRLKDQGIPLPCAASLMSPITFMDSMEGSHTDLAALDLILAEDSFILSDVAELYAPGMDKKEPYLSPLYGDLQGLPPMQIFVGTDEKLFDDSIRFYQKSRLAGNEVELIVGDHMTHSWPIFMNQFPEAETAVRQMADFVHRHLVQGGRAQEQYYEQWLLRMALEEIDRNYAQANLSALAARHNQTLYSYSKLIKQRTGKTFKQLLKKKRFSVVEQRLIETGDSVKKIASDVGYENLTHFYDYFRKKYGETPQQFREKHGQNSNPAKNVSVQEEK